MAITNLQTELAIGGGPVCPVVSSTGGTVHAVGMTMRQQYACAALTGLLGNSGSRATAVQADYDAMCTRAFQIADAMLVAESVT